MPPQSWSPETRHLIKHLEQVVFVNEAKKDESSAPAASTSKAAPRQTTFRPFKLSEGKPKLPPPEEPKPERYRAKPAPKFAEGPTKEQRALEAAREKNRKEVAQKYMDPAGGKFQLASDERPMKLPELLEQARREFEAQHEYRPVVAKPVPDAPDAEVRLNAAAILREDAVYRKKQAEEAAALRAFEQELHDSTAFDRWRAEALARDERERAEEVERRRREMAAAQEAAIRAKEAQVEENKAVAQEMKKEREVQLREVAEEAEVQRLAAAILAEDIRKGREATRRAVERQEAENRQAAEELKRRQAEDARRLAAQAEAELRERQEAIRQLRALLTAREKFQRKVDPTWVPNLGLLGEMSLLELKERVVQVRERVAIEEEEQRQRNQRTKEERQSVLMAKAANISKARKLAHAQAVLRRARREEESRAAALEKERAEEVLVRELDAKLRAKREKIREEKARVEEEVRRAKFEQQGLGASAAQVEAKKFLELRKGAEREIVERQTRAKEEAEQYESMQAKLQATHLGHARAQIKARLEGYAAHDRVLAEDVAVAVADHEADLARKKGLVAQTREFEATLQLRTGRGPAGSLVRPPGAKRAALEASQAMAEVAEL